MIRADYRTDIGFNSSVATRQRMKPVNLMLETPVECLNRYECPESFHQDFFDEVAIELL